MKKAILILFLFLISAPVHSQAYFNFRFEFDQPGWWDGATNVFLLQDGYIIGGGAVSFENYLKLGFYKVDFQGNKIFLKAYGDTLSDYFLGNPGTIISVYSDTILAVGTKKEYTSTWVHDQGLLFFFNSDFDTLYTKRFGEKIEPYDTSYIFHQVKIDAGNDVIISGTKWPETGFQMFLLIKTDSRGNLKWERTYNLGSYWQGHSVVCTSDGGYAIGGFAWAPNPPPNLTGDPIVVKTDSAGNQEWFKNYGTQYIDSRGMLCSTQDGNMIVGFGFCDSMYGGGPSAEGSAFRRIDLIKIDNAGNTIWNQKYGRSEYEKALLNIRENPDGSIISTGITHHSKEYSSKDYGWILKTSACGDSIWYREYAVCYGEDSDNWLYDVIETSDEGYLACGVVYPKEPDTGSQDGWILKVDSLGCERVDYCWVGMKDETPLPANDELGIYPNPVAEDISVKLRITGNELRISIRLYDLFGRMVKMVELSPGQTEFRMDVSELPDGMYYVVVSPGDKIRTCKKLIKQRM